MSDLIQQLKDNEKPFGLMTEEMQAKILSVEYRHVEHFSPGSVWSKLVMKVEGYDDHETWSFRLRPDYAEKPSVVEIPVKIYQGSLHYQGIAGMRALASAPNYADFLGFKYDSGCVSPLPRIYRFGDGMGGSLHYTVNHETLAEDDRWEVLTPTHVLFSGATK